MRSRCIQTELFGQCLSKYFFWLGGFQSSLLRPVSDRRAKGCVTYAHCITGKLWKFVNKNRPLLYRLSPNARKRDETFNNLKKKIYQIFPGRGKDQRWDALPIDLFSNDRIYTFSTTFASLQ